MTVTHDTQAREEEPGMQKVESPAVQAPVSNPSILDPRVERGAALLDEQMPGWWRHIDAENINLLTANRCVLGQIGLCVFNHDFYKTAKKLLGDSEGAWAEHGFWPTENNNAIGRAEFAALDVDWRLAILSRRVLDTADPPGSAPTVPERPRVVAQHREAGSDE